MTPLASVLIWSLAFATSDEDLNTWWRQHKALIDRIPEADRVRLVEAGKEARARLARSNKTRSYT